jgi:hypothetical protein
MASNILHRISKKGKTYLHSTMGAIICDHNGTNLSSHFKPFWNVKCQSSNVKSNPNFKYQKICILEFDIHLAFVIGHLDFIFFPTTVILPPVDQKFFRNPLGFY